MCGLRALRKQGEAGDEKGLVHGSLRVSPPCILSPQHFGKELAPESQFPGVADMLCDDSRYPGYFTRLAEKHLNNSLLLNRLCAYVRFTDCYLLKTRQNKTECHNSFNNNT